MTPRKRNATLGLLVGVALSLYLIVRLILAAAPAPTSIKLTNLGSALVTVTDLSIGGKGVLQERVTLHPASAGASAPESSSRVLDLAPGRPLEIRAHLTGPNPVAACSLTPRPQGVCFIRASFLANSELQCEYECKTEP